MEKSGIKRSTDDAESKLDHIKAVLVDVEGTITPPTFFQDVLVKYITDNVEAYITTHFTSEVMTKRLDGWRKQAADEVAAGLEGAVAIPEGDDVKVVAPAVAANVKGQFDNYRCSTEAGELYLEMLQAAFKSKALLGKIYDDVPSTLKKLTTDDIKVYAYGECCKDTTKLQLEYSDHGDLTGMFSGFYDYSKFGTKVGSTLAEKDTYTKFAAELQVDADQVFFLTHKATDAAVAHSAGLKSCVISRGEAVETKSSETDTLCHCKSLSELFKCCTEVEETSPRKKQRVSGSHVEGSVVEPKVCVETAGDGEKKAAAE